MNEDQKSQKIVMISLLFEIATSRKQMANTRHLNSTSTRVRLFSCSRNRHPWTASENKNHNAGLVKFCETCVFRSADSPHVSYIFCVTLRAVLVDLSQVSLSSELKKKKKTSEIKNWVFRSLDRLMRTKYI